MSQTHDASSVTHHVSHAISTLEIAPHAEMELNYSLMPMESDFVVNSETALSLTAHSVHLQILIMSPTVRDACLDIYHLEDTVLLAIIPAIIAL